MVNNSRSTRDLAVYDAMSTHQSAAAHVPFQSFAAFGIGEDNQPKSSLWAVLDDRMRGRWRPALMVGLILSIVLALAGYLTGAPAYRSAGAIRVAQQVPAVLKTTEIHTRPDADRFRATQVQLIKSPRVLEQAMQDDEVKKLNSPVVPRTVKDVKANLTVTPNRESELIYVEFESQDPTVAQTVTNAVLPYYSEI